MENQWLREAQMMSLPEKNEEIVRLRKMIQELSQELETTRNERDDIQQFLTKTIQWFRSPTGERKQEKLKRKTMSNVQ